MKTDDDMVALCPDCKYEISLGPEPEKGESLTCPNCWAYLIVVSVEPLELSWDSVEDDDEDDDLGESDH